MNVFLMYQDRDFDLKKRLPENSETLIQDLELNTLFNAMAQDDPFLLEVANTAVLSSLHDVETILYRQGILKDCLDNSSIIRDIYSVAIESIQNEKKHYFGFRYPAAILHRSIEVLQIFMELLKKLTGIIDENESKFESEGFKLMFAVLKQELSNDFFYSVENHLKDLRRDNGVLISVKLGKGNKGDHYLLRQPSDIRRGWMGSFFIKKSTSYTFQIHEHDESGARALADLQNRGIILVANALARSVDHMLHFFYQLRNELAFYIGCLNLHERLVEQKAPVCFPLSEKATERRHHVEGLYDVCLSLNVKQMVVGNDVLADDKDLMMITGANQGGKSTFLRSIGLSQLMMQCGMFVPAHTFSANICNGVFTHFKREEDATMNSGKLDEELHRMSKIADIIRPNSLLLFNESFAATNEREGSEIAKQITLALIARRIKVLFVTHLYEFAEGLYDANMNNASFLRAERYADGSRTFKIIEGRPLQTSYGEDLYREIFGKI